MTWCSPNLPLHLLLIFSLLYLFVGRAVVSGFKICSYNVEGFSPQKVQNRKVFLAVTKIVSQCDICLLQNVMDPQGKAIDTLLSALNRIGKHQYQKVASEGLGNSPDNMQRYVYFYRTKSVKVTGTYQYRSNKAFLRDPFVVKFQSNKTEIKDFILVPLHSDVNRVVEELDKLYDVFVAASKKWNNTNVMFLGDFHADCGYMTRSDKKKIRLYTNLTFSWLIKDRVDTTTGSDVSCAYDRIVVSGTAFLEAIMPLSAKPFDLGTASKQFKAMIRETSNHLPVAVTLKSSSLLLQATYLLILFSAVQSFLSAL